MLSSTEERQDCQLTGNVTAADGAGKLFKDIGRDFAKAGKMLAANVVKNPERTFVYVKAALSTIQGVNFNQTGKRFYFGRIIQMEKKRL